ncbi:unnamed protein product [Arctia plantaginis]|uniref:Uncharacterized protein n=1 Tax=Arctia plantaginis TaxID=874455 RepID=A0A8S0ZT53_ARCPL|nr:unnamed protein product [Arctia plantaginis]
MNLHGLRILDFKTSHSKTVGDGALRKEPNVLVCENEENQKIDNKETSDLREADDQNVSHKTHKTASRKYSFLQRRTSSEIFKNPLQTKVKDQSPKNNSCEDLKVKFKNDKVNQHSRFNFFNKDSILNLHLKGGDIRRNKKRNKQEYDTTVLFDSVSRNKTSTKKSVKNEGMKQRKKNKLLDDTFGFLKNKRSITSCYRQNNKFMNLDQCLVGLKQFKKRKVNNTRVPSVFGGRSRHKNKVTKQCTCVHNPLKILTYESSGYSNIVTPNAHISDGNLGGKGAQEFKTGPGYKAPDNKTPSRNQKFPKVKSAFRNKAAKKKGSAAECKCPPSNYWEKQLESKIQMKKDAFVSVSSASLEPKIYCGCDAAVATDKSKLTTRKRSKTDKCCQMKRNTPRVVADSCEPDENPQSHNFNTIKKERLEELVKEERNTFFTDFINDMVDFRVGQTKHRFPVQCMKYICLGLLVIVWSPCLLALFLGRVIMCPQRISCSLGGPQLMKQMQTNSNCTWNGKNKRSLNEIHRKEIPMNTPVNYVKCLPAACIKANLPTHSAAKRFKNFQDKSLPTECQQKKMHAHSLSKAKRKCLVTRDERPQESSNILMNYLRNRFPTSECPRSQKSNQRQKKFMSSVASWCTRTVASFSNVVSVVKLIGFRLPTGTRTSFIPSLNTTQRNRCSLYYGNGRGWIVKPQVIQNMRCEYSSDLRLSSSSKDCILKPKSKISFSEQPDCPSDCVYNRTRTSKVDPDSHFSTVLFGNYKTTNQQLPACSTSHFQAKILSENPDKRRSSPSFSKLLYHDPISLPDCGDITPKNVCNSSNLRLSAQNTSKISKTPTPCGKEKKEKATFKEEEKRRKNETKKSKINGEKKTNLRKETKIGEERKKEKYERT